MKSWSHRLRPSTPSVNRVADLCHPASVGRLEVERHRHRPDRQWVGPPLGDMLVGRRAGGRPVAEGGRRLLMLAHMDTVFDEGTAAARPFGVRGRRAYGPGITDDKAGVVCGFEAVEVLCDLAGFDDFAASPWSASRRGIGSPFAALMGSGRENELAVGGGARQTERCLGRQGHLGLHLEIEGRPCTPGYVSGGGHRLEAATDVALQALNGRGGGTARRVRRVPPHQCGPDGRSCRWRSGR